VLICVTAELLAGVCTCSSEVALVYNDRSVLENFHVSAVFRLLRDDDYNVLNSLKTDEFRSVGL